VAKLGTIDRASCRRRAEEEYTPEVVASRYVDLYERARAALASRR
jgi:glycosyltransferase involved in cell wall biosynthesis